MVKRSLLQFRLGFHFTIISPIINWSLDKFNDSNRKTLVLRQFESFQLERTIDFPKSLPNRRL